MSTDHQRRELVVALEDVEWRDSGDPGRKDEVTLRGHAAVFNSLSEDLGGFRELIEPGFFGDALRQKPDVRLLINHDGLPLARTASGTLDLSEDERGLRVFARLDRSDPDVQQLQRKMERGDVDQMSFAFTLRENGDDWDVAEDKSVTRRLLPGGADELFDVSVVTFPAYRSTEVSMRSILTDAIEHGRLPDLEAKANASDSDEPEDAVASSEEGSTDQVAEATPGEEHDAAPDDEVVPGADEKSEEDVEQAPDAVAELKERSRARRDELAESYLRLLKEHNLA